jgi:hypothetical protein
LDGEVGRGEEEEGVLGVGWWKGVEIERMGTRSGLES